MSLAGNYDVRAGAVYTVLAGAAGLTKTTSGTATLAAADTYTDGTLISLGTLQLGDGNTSATLSGSITNNAAILFNPGAAGATYGNVISGSGSITKIGSGTVAFTPINTYQGSTTISNGAITLDSDATLGDGTGTLNLSGGTLTTTASRSVNANPVSNAINLTADSAITTSSTAASVDANFSSASIGGSAGTLTFSNAAAAGTGLYDPRFSGGSFTFSQPIVIANGAFGTTRLSSFNTNGTTQTFNGVISGTGAFRRSIGAGTGGVTVFNANNTYSGATTLNGGTLLVNGAIGSGAVAVNTGTLGGNGTINGPVTVQNSGIVSAGTSIGILTISNSLAFLASSTNLVEINRTIGTNDLVRGLSTVTYGGTLVVSVLSGTLAAADSFKIFDAANYSGAFAAIIPATPGANLTWDTNSLAANGTLKVVSSAVAQPQIETVSLSGTNLILTGSGGTAGADYYVLTSTNLIQPRAAWTSIATNQFITGGNFNFTNAVDPLKPTLFYILQVP